MSNLPALLLVLGSLRHLGWQHSSEPALFWNLSGSITIAALVIIAWRSSKSLPTTLVSLWLLYEESLVGICSVWRMSTYWPASESQELCSAKIGVNIGAISLILIGLIIYRVATHDSNK